MLVIRARIHKMLTRIANWEDSDLSLHCLSMFFWQATSVQNFRTSTIVSIAEQADINPVKVIFT